MGLGARRVDGVVNQENGSSWLLMADPEGNEFCVCDGGAADDARPERPGPDRAYPETATTAPADRE